jgi:hypothetical protein
MAHLSTVVEEGRKVRCANHIHPTKKVELRDGASLIFEIMESDADSLKSRVAKVEPFVFDSQAFCGELLSLEPCETTIPSLSLMGKPVMRGILKIHKMLPCKQCKPDYQN